MSARWKNPATGGTAKVVPIGVSGSCEVYIKEKGASRRLVIESKRIGAELRSLGFRHWDSHKMRWI